MFSEEFLLQSPWYNRTGLLGVKHQLIYFSYSPYASVIEEIFIHFLGYVLWGVSLVISVSNFSYTPDASFSEEFLLHSTC